MDVDPPHDAAVGTDLHLTSGIWTWVGIGGSAGRIDPEPVDHDDDVGASNGNSGHANPTEVPELLMVRHSQRGGSGDKVIAR
jgi:hypothetical protein